MKGLTISGTLRAYDLERLNTPEYSGGKATGPNRQAFNFGGVLRADYKLGNTPFAIGGAFWGAYPFGLNGGSVGCNVGGGLIVQEPAALCAKNNAGLDNSVPAYPLETFEYYVKYTDKTAAITIGDQLLNKAWEPSADSRIKPSLYQAGDATINLTNALSLGLTRVVRFEGRAQSIFNNCTNLTCLNGIAPAGAGLVSGTPSNTPSTGADRVALGFKPNSRFSLLTEGYRFHNIADLVYLESKYNVIPKNVYNPFVAFQFVNETQSGNAVLGKILNQTVGLQLGANVTRNLLLTVAADSSPWNYTTVTSAKCQAAPSNSAYFVPAGGTTGTQGIGSTACIVTPATKTAAAVKGFRAYRVAYGGIASPYSDSYTADPLYSTTITGSMVDRRSAGSSYKGQLTFTSDNKRIVAIVAEGIYNFDTNFGRNRTYELDADITYNFNAVRAGAYKGLSLRERLADRTQPTLPFNFKYVRHQLQYSF